MWNFLKKIIGVWIRIPGVPRGVWAGVRVWRTKNPSRVRIGPMLGCFVSKRQIVKVIYSSLHPSSFLCFFFRLYFFRLRQTFGLVAILISCRVTSIFSIRTQSLLCCVRYLLQLEKLHKPKRQKSLPLKLLPKLLLIHLLPFPFCFYLID